MEGTRVERKDFVKASRSATLAHLVAVRVGLAFVPRSVVELSCAQLRAIIEKGTK